MSGPWRIERRRDAWWLVGPTEAGPFRDHAAAASALRDALVGGRLPPLTTPQEPSTAVPVPPGGAS